MAVRTLITAQGLQLLADSSYASGQYYWIGYYALAYVPDFWKSSNATELTFPENNCGQVNVGTPITPTDTDRITPTMTRLTDYGDMIWNVWQGDLTGGGYNAGGDLFNLTSYNTNVSKNYRYILDENGNNLLVAWRKDPTSPEGKMIGAMAYYGTDGYMRSELPIPAPLYYLGDVTGKSNIGDFFSANTPTFKQEHGPYGNGADIYPFITVTLEDSTTINVPRVSADYRGFLDYNNGTTGWMPPPNPIFNARDIASADPVFAGNVTAWFDGNKTWQGEVDGVCTEFWKIHTISNYNRWHAPVNNIGFIVNDDLSVRNMSKVTKFFPISNYKVITTQKGTSIDGQEIEVATSLGVEINLDISPKTLAPGYNETGYYDENGNLGYFDLYSCDPNTNPSCTVSPIKDLNGQPIYNTTHTSFKFNRIGLYALPILKAPYSIGDGESSNLSCVDLKLQYQVNPDLEPVLFAVADWDNTITLDNTGDGIHQFLAEINLNLSSPNGVDCSIVRDSVIFYNMYEDDAQTWYKNQLVATASTQNAITEIGLEVGALRQQQINGVKDCCPMPNVQMTSSNIGTSSLRNILDANQVLDGGLKGIDTMSEGADLYGSAYKVGIDSLVLGSDTAVMGDYSSVVGGVGNIISNITSESFIGGGFTNIINSNTSMSSILGGDRNAFTNPIKVVTSDIDIIYGNAGFAGMCPYLITIELVTAVDAVVGNLITITGTQQYNVSNATITGITGNVITFISNTLNGNITETTGSVSIKVGVTTSIASSAIISGSQNIIEGNATTSMIGGGLLNKITGGATASTILGGFTNLSTNTQYSLIGSGSLNSIANSRNSSIISGFRNTVTDTVNGGIFAGYQNEISGVGYSSIILGGVSNKIDVGINYINGGSLIGAGSSNVITPKTVDTVIYNSEESSILSGKGNTISGSKQSFIGAGLTNLIDYSNTASITSGSENIISVSNYSGIVTGQKNSVVSSVYSFIGGGGDNTMNGVSYSGILGGYDNNIMVDLAAAQAYINDNSTSYVFAYLQVGSGSKYMSIIGGDSNFIDTSYQANILGGSRNTIIYSADSTILGGADNSILLAQNSGVFGGNFNALNDCYISTIVNGEYNWIGGSSDSSIMNGDFNYITNSTFSTILNGIGNNMYNTHYSTILNGSYVRADYTGEVIHNAENQLYPQQPNHSTIMYHYFSNDSVLLNAQNAGWSGDGVDFSYNYIYSGISNTSSYTTNNITGELTALSGEFINCNAGDTFAGDVTTSIHVEYKDGLNVAHVYDVLFKEPVLVNDNAMIQGGKLYGQVISGGGSVSVDNVVNLSLGVSGPTLGAAVGRYTTGEIYVQTVFGLRSTVDSATLFTLDVVQITSKFDGIYRKSTT